jgi:hypothetical protein
VKHILLECNETKHWRMKLMHDKWLSMNKEVACRKIVGYAVTQLVEELRYKPEGRRFDSQWGHWSSLVT